ncbi:MAG TPA: hypothetical protein VLM76_06065, partial [Patescibacteria group bacterium]|nr:hypothetical protein [Patescibacteria group bacterium]
MSPDQITYVLVALIVTGVAILLLLVGAMIARRGRDGQRPPAPIPAPVEPVAAAPALAPAPVARPGEPVAAAPAPATAS